MLPVVELYDNRFYHILIELLNDIKKVKEEELIAKNLVLDEDNKVFSYFIKKLDRINELFKKFKKVILTDATMKKEIVTGLFPDFRDDCLFLGDNKYRSSFGGIYMANSKYHKPTLWNMKTNYPRKSYHTLSEKVGWLLEEYRHQKIFIAGFQVFEPYLKRDHKEKLKKMDVVFDHFGNIEGKNKFDKCYVVIVFGSPGIPSKITDVYVNMFGIDRKFIMDLVVQQYIIQIIERIRPLYDPYKKIAIILTNEAKEYFPKAKDLGKFIKYKYRNIIDYLAKSGWTSIKEIMELIKKTDKTTKKILNLLLNEGFIKTQKRRIEGEQGRPLDLWNVK